MKWGHLYSNLNILWHSLSLGLEWKLPFSSPVATNEFSKFVGILSAALSQSHLLGFELAQLEFHSSTSFVLVLLPEATLTSPSRMSGSQCMTMPWLSGPLRSRSRSSSVRYCSLLLVSSASLRSFHLCSADVTAVTTEITPQSLLQEGGFPRT